MKRKMIALFLIFAMLVPLSSAVAADEMSATPTVEEILNEYHRKAFEAQIQGDTETASTWSRRSGNTKTLEQETVDTLTEAGYEAYNVTADNYETLQAELKTDFATMGLDPEGSYIMVISGEEAEETAPENSVAPLNISPNPEITQPPDGGGSTLFEYIYDDETYYMRYVTVTATENSHLRQIDDVTLNEELGPYNAIEIAGMASSVIGFLSDSIIVDGITTCVVMFNTPVSISLLLLDLLPDYTPKLTDLIRMTGSCVWTVQYTQIYDFGEEQWFLNAGVEYVTVQKYVDYDIYNPNTYLYDSTRVYYDNEVIYSALYNEPETMKQRAVLAYLYGQGDNRHLDKVDKVEFTYGGNEDGEENGEEESTVLTLYRTIYDLTD